MNWKCIQEGAFPFSICVFVCLLLTEKLPVTIMKTDFVSFCIICTGFVCWCSGYPRSQSAGNIISYLFCQPNTEFRVSLCESQIGCHEYLKRLWFSVSACCMSVSPGQERGDQTEVRRQDVPRICTSEGGESVKCWMLEKKNSAVHLWVCFLSQVCYIFLHVLSFSTCRTKRSSWRTLRPHRRHASTSGSVEWRTRLSISESTNFFFHDLLTCSASLSGLPWRCLCPLKLLPSGLFVSGKMRCELPLTFSWMSVRWHETASTSALPLRYDSPVSAMNNSPGLLCSLQKKKQHVSSEARERWSNELGWWLRVCVGKEREHGKGRA